MSFVPPRVRVRPGSSTSRTTRSITARSNPARRPRSTSSSASAPTTVVPRRPQALPPPEVTHEGRARGDGRPAVVARSATTSSTGKADSSASPATDGRERMSTYGKHLLQDRWTGHEHDVMAACGRPTRRAVPVAYADDVLDIEYVGDFDGPRRSCAPPGSAATSSTVRSISWSTAAVDDRRAGFAHGDLSAYNLLWWEGEALVHRLPAGRRHRRQPAGPRLPPS